MDERDLEPEEPAVRLLVDHLDALLGELRELAPQVGHLVRDVVHSRPPFYEELADGSVVTERSDELDPALPEAHRGRLDSLRLDEVAILELGSEDPLVRVDGLVEVLDRDPQVMNPVRPHAQRMLSAGC